jgi:pyochelin biosynthesis protein PchC
MCFPHAGGSASAYFTLAEKLAPGIEVLGVQYPGRQDRRHDPPVADLLDLADQIFRALEQGSDRRPLAFFGHSMGATLAYEVARRLERKTAEPLRMLFASGRRAPSRIRPERVHLGDDDGVLAELIALNGTDARLLRDAEMRELILPVVRGDYAAIEGYRWRPGPALSCPISILVGDADPLTTIEEARAWADYSTAGADVRIFPGGHFYLEAHQEEVARVIAQRLTDPV